MLLGALSELGALDDLTDAVASIDLPVVVEVGSTTRRGLAATSVRVAAAGDQPQRRLGEVLALIDRCDVPQAVRDRAAATFRRLADVEAKAHGITADEVHFHEVGALDAVADVLGCCLGLHRLALDELVVSPIALGGGTAAGSHGALPVPTPAALGLLRGSVLVGHGGPVDVELATPTGVAVLAEWATASGPMPALTVETVGIGAGSRDLAERPNVVRLVVGAATEPTAEPAAGDWLVIEANVDDLDPRLWPGVLDRLLTAGAADAWLTPILMKKGRPAHTVAALAPTGAADEIRRVLTSETSTIGTRSSVVTKQALERSWITVTVDNQEVRVKIAHQGGDRSNLAPEFDDVAAAAANLGRPVKEVLARATAAALQALEP
jgi:pyridinium-3,5-bisthiocarboxylic acid mononucleotide nickel chelatase